MNDTDLRAHLERRRHKLALSLPAPETFLRASLFTRTRRCGNVNCRCATGKGHTTTYLSANLPDGGIEQISLPADLVPEARRWISAYHRWWRSVEQISAINREFFRRRWIKPGALARRKT